MSAPPVPWTVWIFDRRGVPDRIGPFLARGPAVDRYREVVRCGALVRGDVVAEHTGVDASELAKLREAARAWFAGWTPPAVPAETFPLVIAIDPADYADEHETGGVGAATEVPKADTFAERAEVLRVRLGKIEEARLRHPPTVPTPRYDKTFAEGTAWLDDAPAPRAEAPLPAPWDAPIDDVAPQRPRCGMTHHADCDCQRAARGEARLPAVPRPRRSPPSRAARPPVRPAPAVAQRPCEVDPFARLAGAFAALREAVHAR